MKILKKENGSTMVELIVTFALLALYGASLVMVLTYAGNIYYNAAGSASAETVSETLLDKICGEISGAQGGVKAEYTFTVMDRDSIPEGEESKYLPYESGSCISFCNRTGSPIYIALEDGRLLIHYRPVNDHNINLKAVDWKFDEKMYKGNTIQDLKFAIVYNGEKRTNVIKIMLTLKNDRSGYLFTSERFVECYNFENTEVSKISYEGVFTDSAHQVGRIRT